MAGIDNQQNLHGNEGGRTVSPTAFTALARELAAFDGLVVGVMEDPAFAGQEEPAGLRCAHFQSAWGGPDVRVVPLTADQIRSHAVVFRGAIDILVKYYQCPRRPAAEAADVEMLPELAGAAWTPSPTGVVVNNSAHDPVPKLPAGNVFPERTPARTGRRLSLSAPGWSRRSALDPQRSAGNDRNRGRGVSRGRGRCPLHGAAVGSARRQP